VVVVVLLIWAGIGGLIGYAIGNSKGRGTEGFWLGFFLGIIGWIIEAFQKPTGEVAARQEALATVVDAQAREVQMRDQLRPCPFCAELIQPAAKVCRYCGRDVEPLAEPSLDQQMADLGLEHPEAYPQARVAYDRLPTKPSQPLKWLTELCLRIEAGSPADAAAEKIPLDWNGG
jgi:hypothetical protein